MYENYQVRELAEIVFKMKSVITVYEEYGFDVPRDIINNLDAADVALKYKLHLERKDHLRRIEQRLAATRTAKDLRADLEEQALRLRKLLEG